MAKGYYATVQRGEGAKTRTAWLAGPFATHEEALAIVDRAWDVACDIDPKMAFDARGTSSISYDDREIEALPKGRINHILGI